MQTDELVAKIQKHPDTLAVEVIRGRFVAHARRLPATVGPHSLWHPGDLCHFGCGQQSTVGVFDGKGNFGIAYVCDDCYPEAWSLATERGRGA